MNLAASQPSVVDALPADAVLRAIESASTVRRRHHLFVWMQSYLASLLPHRIAVCGSYDRQRRALRFEAFSSVVLPPQLIEALAHPEAWALQRLVESWVRHGCSAQWFAIEPDGPLGQLHAIGVVQVLVHGVARPQRPRELESLFILGSPGGGADPQAPRVLDLLLPHLHSTYLRVQSVELALGTPPATPAPVRRPAREVTALSSRELQILALMREGLSNHQIGAQLSISGLTVKNHAQNIFRKLGASNRAQAVACAMAQRWLSDEPPLSSN